MKQITQDDRIKAAKHFKIEKFGFIRHSALKYCLFEYYTKKFPDIKKLLKIADRFKVADAFGFYSTRPEFWFS